jgi:integrase
MPFDARAARLLQAGQHITIIPEHPGLRLVAGATKRTWIYRYRSLIDDGLRQVKIGEWPKMGYPEAAVEWAKLREQRDASEDPALQKRAARRKEVEEAQQETAGPYLIKHLVEDYLTGHIDKNRKPKGRAEVRRLLRRSLAAIGDTPVEQLQRSQAFNLLESLSDTPVLALQVRQEMGAATDYGLDAGKLPPNTPNWWRQIMKGRLRSKGKKIDGEHTGGSKRVLSEQEIGTLINWLPNFSRTVADALTLYLWTGTRGAEIVGIEKDEITEEPGGWWWTLPKEKTKNMRRENATDLRVPLVGRAREVALRRRELTERFLFPTERDASTPIDQKMIQGGVYHHQPYCKTKTSKVNSRPRLPVTHWAPHDLRRSVRTLLAKMGCPNDVAESVLGHMQHGIVGVYNRHAYDDERLEWLTRLDVRLEQLAQQYAAAS